jgi:hypothetical protein
LIARKSPLHGIDWEASDFGAVMGGGGCGRRSVARYLLQHVAQGCFVGGVAGQQLETERKTLKLIFDSAIYK